MRKLLMVSLAVMVCVGLAGCTQPATTDGTQPAPAPTAETPTATAPAAGEVAAQAVYTDTLSTKAYKSWPTAPGYETIQPAKGPHGKQVQIYVNDTVEKTLSGGAATTWPTGSAIVKDVYDAGGTLTGWEYMQKTDQGWFYASYGADGAVKKEGVNAEPCNACHANNSSDSVKAFKLPQ
jgi:hypothetical protein